MKSTYFNSKEIIKKISLKQNRSILSPGTNFLWLSISFSVFLAVFSVTSLHSQSDDTIHLREVRIISSKLDLMQRQSGRSVSVITGELISQTPASSVDEIIRYLPGLETQSRNLYGVQTDYSIRGSTFNQVLVMVDGMRLNDPLTGHFNSCIPVPLSEISRIELIRGPATVMFGPDAVGGVINIITKNFTYQGDSASEINLFLGGGAHGLYYTDAGINKSFNNWQLGGGFRLLSSSGFPTDDGFHDDFNLRTATASTSGLLGKRTRVSFRTAVDSRDFSARRFYTISTADTARETVQGWWNHLGFVRSGDKSTNTLDLAYKAGSDEYIFNPLVQANKHTTGNFTGQFRNNRSFGDNIRIATGIHINHRTIKSNDRGDHDEFFGGIYSLAFLALPADIYISGGLRIESDRYSDIIFLPQLNLSWIKGKLSLRSLAGKTMRTPDFTERYVSTNLPILSSGRNLGNPFLQPESSWSFEAGSDINLISGLSAGLTIFTRLGNNLIDYVLTPSINIPDASNLNPDGSYFYSRNIGEVNTYGIELTMNGSLSFARGLRIDYNAGYTIQESVNPKGELSKYISNQARQLFTLSSLLSHGRVGFGLSSIMKQRESDFAESIGVPLNPSYKLVNLQGRYILIPKLLTLEIRVENLFNVEYSDILGAQLPGIWISGGIRLSNLASVFNL